MSLQSYDTRTVLLGAAQFLLADGTSWKTLAANNLGDRRIEDVVCCNSGGTDRTVEFRFTLSAVTRHLGSVVVPAGAGYAGVAPVQAMATVAPTNVAGWPLTSAITLEARLTVAMAGADILDTVAYGGYF